RLRQRGQPSNGSCTFSLSRGLQNAADLQGLAAAEGRGRGSSRKATLCLWWRRSGLVSVWMAAQWGPPRSIQGVLHRGIPLRGGKRGPSLPSPPAADI